MNRFDSRAEQALLTQVREVQAHVNEGLSPNDAIVKTAQAHHTHPDVLPLLVQTYNVGRQAYQQEKCGGSGVLCLVKEFPIADLGTVKSALYPAEPVIGRKLKLASAVSAEYDAPPAPRRTSSPTYVKAAAHAPAAPAVKGAGDAHTHQRWREAGRMALDRIVNDHEVKLAESVYDFAQKMGDAARYFKLSMDSYGDFDDVAFNAQRMLGPGITPLLTELRQGVKQAKQASARPEQLLPVSVHDAPYSLLKTALDAARNYQQIADDLAAVKEGAAQRKEALRPFSKSGEACTCQQGSPILGHGCSCHKQAASWLTPAVTGASAGFATNIKSRMDPSSLSSGMESQLDDPDHLEELKSIQARAMLTNLLNHDEVISGYDPSEVTNAYNDLVQLTPSAATQPAIMTPLLRKRLTAGGMEAFDAQQAAELEKTVQQNFSSAQPKSNVSKPVA